MWKKGSNRSAPLPENWKRIRSRVLIRDGYMCQHIMQSGVDAYGNDMVGRICGRRASDVHHINDEWNHAMTNLVSLCGYHHGQITSANAFKNKKHKNKYGKDKKHPGLV